MTIKFAHSPLHESFTTVRMRIFGHGVAPSNYIWTKEASEEYLIGSLVQNTQPHNNISVVRFLNGALDNSSPYHLEIAR